MSKCNMMNHCAGVSAKQFDILLKVMKQQQEQKPKLQPVQSALEEVAHVTPQEVCRHIIIHHSKPPLQLVLLLAHNVACSCFLPETCLNIW